VGQSEEPDEGLLSALLPAEVLSDFDSVLVSDLLSDLPEEVPFLPA
jgi:hypothetical protein